MKLKRLRIYTTEKDRMEGLPLYEWLAQAAYREGLAGVSVFRGIGGYCAKKDRRLSGHRIFEINLPVILETVEREEKLLPFIEKIRNIRPVGILTLEDVEIFSYGGKNDQ